MCRRVSFIVVPLKTLSFFRLFHLCAWGVPQDEPAMILLGTVSPPGSHHVARFLQEAVSNTETGETVGFNCWVDGREGETTTKKCCVKRVAAY
mgnify:CR=1 FL=1